MKFSLFSLFRFNRFYERRLIFFFFFRTKIPIFFLTWWSSKRIINIALILWISFSSCNALKEAHQTANCKNSGTNIDFGRFDACRKSSFSSPSLDLYSYSACAHTLHTNDNDGRKHQTDSNTNYNPLEKRVNKN